MEWYTAAEKFNQALASADPTPGGGAAAAMAATMGCSLALMAVQTTKNRPHVDAAVQARLETALHKLLALKTQLTHFIEEDSIAYAAYLVARKMPKEDPQRPQALEKALVYAARIPADTATTAITCLREVEALAPDIAPVIMSDVLCAKHLLKGAIACCVENIKANLTFIQDKTTVEKFTKQLDTFAKSY